MIPNDNLLSGHQLVFETEKLPKWRLRWERFRKSPTGAFIAISLTALAFIFSCSTALVFKTLIWSAALLAIGGAVAGFRNLYYGKSFWNGFLHYINDEWAMEVTIEMLAIVMVSALSDLVTQCFIAGTLVLTSLGLKKIEEIKVGDKVWSYNEKTKKKELKRVKNIFRNKTNKWLHLIVKINESEEEVICTTNHRFYVNEKGWIDAINIIENDELLLYNNKGKVIKKIFAIVRT